VTDVKVYSVLNCDTFCCAKQQSVVAGSEEELASLTGALGSVNDCRVIVQSCGDSLLTRDEIQHSG